jgi:hypothetical protein
VVKFGRAGFAAAYKRGQVELLQKDTADLDTMCTIFEDEMDDEG